MSIKQSLFFCACCYLGLAVLIEPQPWAMAAASPPASAQLSQARALRAQARQLDDDAMKEYRAVLRREPRNLEAERGLARVLRDRGAEEQALPYLRDVAERSRDGLDDARLGWALFRAGRWAEATDAFAAARWHGQNDPETVRGAALAGAAARAALAAGEGSDHAAGALAAQVGPANRDRGSADESGWRRAWGSFWNATGFITATVQHMLLWMIALVIAGGVAMRAWSTLMGHSVPRDEGSIPLHRFRGLRVLDLHTGRSLGRVRRVIYDPKLARVVGFQTGGRYRWQVVPLSAARGVGAGGLLLPDAGALVPSDRAGELGALAQAGSLPLGSGSRLKRVVTEDGALLAFTRPDRLWMSGTTGQVTFEVTPNRFHDAWRVALAVLQFGPVDWLLGKLLDWGLELLPGRLSARIRLPVSLIRSADREVVIVSPEAVEWIDEHFHQVQAEAQARLAQVREGVARAKPMVKAGVRKARPVVQAGVDRARPFLERALDSGAAFARRSAEAVTAGTRRCPGGSEPGAPTETAVPQRETPSPEEHAA